MQFFSSCKNKHQLFVVDYFPVQEKKSTNFGTREPSQCYMIQLAKQNTNINKKRKPNKNEKFASPTT